jgi:hypothetical protein
VHVSKLFALTFRSNLVHPALTAAVHTSHISEQPHMPTLTVCGCMVMLLKWQCFR